MPTLRQEFSMFSKRAWMQSKTIHIPRFVYVICGFTYSHFGMIGGAYGIGFLLLAVMLHSISKPFAIMWEPLSALGWGPNYSSQVFRTGIVTIGLFVSPFIFKMTKILFIASGRTAPLPAADVFTIITSVKIAVADEREAHDKYPEIPIIGKMWVRITKVLTCIGFFCSIVALLGLWMVAIFYDHTKPTYYLHIVGGTTYYTTTAFLICFYTLAMLTSGIIADAVIVTCTLVIEILGTTLFLGVIPLFIKYGGLTVITIYRDVSNSEERIRIMYDMTHVAGFFPALEWIIAMCYCVWFIIAGYYVANLEKSIRYRQTERQKRRVKNSDTED